MVEKSAFAVGSMHMQHARSGVSTENALNGVARVLEGLRSYCIDYCRGFKAWYMGWIAFVGSPIGTPPRS